MDKVPNSDPGSAWRNQPVERPSMSPADFRERARQWRSESRNGVLAALGAVLAVNALFWKFGFVRYPWDDAALAAATVWAVASAIRFRKQIWPGPPAPGELSMSGADFYRFEAMRRRAHLKATWFWLGPAVLAMAVFVIRLAVQASRSKVPFANIAPFSGLCLIWILLAVRQTILKFREINADLRQPD